MHVLTGELRKAPYTKDNCGQDGQSKMYIIELSEVIKDYQTQEKSYTNYSAMIFAKSPNQISYYDKSLVEGNWVSVASDSLRVDQSECGQYIKLRMENAQVKKTGFIKDGQQAAAPQQSQARQQTNAAMNQNAQQQGGQQPQPQGGFVDDGSGIPF